MPVRRRYYEHGRWQRIVSRMPQRPRFALGLDDPTAVGSRKLEIGPGQYPRPGYLHLDAWPYGRHSEAVAPMWRLPFPASWADEIVAIHALEHAPPPQLLPTLTEWRRVLKPGGIVFISVPNAPAIMESYNRASVPEKWPLMGSILGMYCAPSVRDPTELTLPADHQIVFDHDLLLWALEEAGFENVEDITADVSDRHTQAWDPLVRQYSLTARARAPGSAT